MNKRVKKYLTKFVGKRLNLIYKYSPDKAADKSFRIFLTPRKGRIKEEQKDFLGNALTKKITVDGYKLQTYVWPGGEQRVLLIHGWESNTSRWASLVDQLQAENYTIVSLDAPAHGDSEGKYSDVPLYGKAVFQLAEEYKIQYAVGHSLGGLTLMYQNYRQTIPFLKKMVLLAPAVEMSSLVLGFQKTLNLKLGLIKALEKRFENEYGYSFSEFSMLKLAKDFQIPGLFIHDKDDKIVSYKESLRLAQEWENAEYLLTKGLRHGLKSAAVDKAILNYIATD